MKKEKRRSLDDEAVDYLQKNNVHRYCKDCPMYLKEGEVVDDHIKKHKNDFDRHSIELHFRNDDHTSNFICAADNMSKDNFVSSELNSIYSFRVTSSKFQWICPLCNKNEYSKAAPTLFNDGIMMRAYALTHLSSKHPTVVIPKLFQLEWEILHEETQFDLKSLMESMRERSNVPSRSYRTFYTFDLEDFPNSNLLIKKLSRQGNFDSPSIDMYRMCCVCCSLVHSSSIAKHFRKGIHARLKATGDSGMFFEVDNKSIENIEEEDSMELTFPNELFAYCTVFKTNRRDMFKWRCCLCRNARPYTFVTYVVLRMHALRHIDEHHKYLFTEKFLSYEWDLLKNEMRISIDVRNYNQEDHSIRGQQTFNKKDPNDYVFLPQYHFIPIEFINNIIICGFCFRSFTQVEFMRHISIHGFLSNETCRNLQPTKFSKRAEEMIGRHCFVPKELGQEFQTILSIEGKRLKAKIDRIKDKYMSETSAVSTPLKSDECTPKRRQASINANNLLAEVFKIVQENALKSTNKWDSSSPSSSEVEDSEDEFKIELENKCKKRAGSSLTSTPKRTRIATPRLRPTLRTMPPKQLKELISKEATKRGIQLDESSTSDETDSSDTDIDVVSSTKQKCLSSMKPIEVTKWLIDEGSKRGIDMSFLDTSISSDDE